MRRLCLDPHFSPRSDPDPYFQKKWYHIILIKLRTTGRRRNTDCIETSDGEDIRPIIFIVPPKISTMDRILELILKGDKT